MDALQMLRQDHRKVQELFKRFEETEDPASKKQIAQTALHELRVHAALEEELFYPAAREEISEEEKIAEAEEEHHAAKLLISELEDMEPEDEHYDAKFKVLAESVKHHIEEEESSVIPEIEGGIDGGDLGEKMAERKQELEQEIENGSTPRRGGAKHSGARRHKSGRKAKKR